MPQPFQTRKLKSPARGRPNLGTSEGGGAKEQNKVKSENAERRNPTNIKKKVDHILNATYERTIPYERTQRIKFARAACLIRLVGLYGKLIPPCDLRHESNTNHKRIRPLLPFSQTKSHRQRTLNDSKKRYTDSQMTFSRGL